MPSLSLGPYPINSGSRELNTRDNFNAQSAYVAYRTLYLLGGLVDLSAVSNRDKKQQSSSSSIVLSAFGITALYGSADNGHRTRGLIFGSAFEWLRADLSLAQLRYIPRRDIGESHE